MKVFNLYDTEERVLADIRELTYIGALAQNKFLDAARERLWEFQAQRMTETEVEVEQEPSV